MFFKKKKKEIEQRPGNSKKSHGKSGTEKF